MMSPSRMSMSSATLTLISTQVRHVAVVTGSGVACSQGKNAPAPSPREVDAKGIRWNLNLSSASNVGSSADGRVGGLGTTLVDFAEVSHQPPL